MSELRAGDRVRWNSHGSTARGHVLRRITRRTEAAGRTVAASADEPQYLVRSDNGGEPVHRPDALTRI